LTGRRPRRRFDGAATDLGSAFDDGAERLLEAAHVAVLPDSGSLVVRAWPDGDVRD
jgi:hypothetical protein